MLRRDNTGNNSSSIKNTATINSRNKSNIKNDNNKNLDDGSSIEYELKSQLRGVDLKKNAKVSSGYETSGLCSIM